MPPSTNQNIMGQGYG